MVDDLLIAVHALPMCTLTSLLGWWDIATEQD